MAWELCLSKNARENRESPAVAGVARLEMAIAISVLMR